MTQKLTFFDLFRQKRTFLWGLFILIGALLDNSNQNAQLKINEKNTSVSSTIFSHVEYSKTIAKSNTGFVIDEELVDQDEDETETGFINSDLTNNVYFKKSEKIQICKFRSSPKTRLYILYKQIKIAHS